jgi:hypothetical protein
MPRGWHEAAHPSAPRLDYLWGALLRALKAEGVIAPTGKGRAAKWMRTGLQTAPAGNGHGPGGHQV